VNAKLKSIYIFPAIAVSIILLLVSAFMAIAGGYERTAWLGAAIAAVPIPLLIARLMFAPVERTSENLPLLLLLASFGVLVAAWEQFLEGTSGWGPTAIALFSMVLLIAYIFWYSRFGRVESHQLAVGNKLPEFALTDVQGDEFRSHSLIGSPAILLFYRGNWCPLCMAQIKEIAAKYEDIAKMGINVTLISPQPDIHSRKLAAQYNVPFKFLVDQNNVVAESLGIGVKHGVPVGMPGGYSPNTVLPTLIVTNESGTIVFSDQTDNYRVRPDPDLFLAILRRSGLVSS
jgi:peroxiredoxin